MCANAFRSVAFRSQSESGELKGCVLRNRHLPVGVQTCNPRVREIAIYNSNEIGNFFCARFMLRDPAVLESAL